jgi:hypothetical protein
MENAAMAAAMQLGLKGKKQHRDKVQLANVLHKKLVFLTLASYWPNCTARKNMRCTET